MMVDGCRRTVDGQDQYRRNLMAKSRKRTTDDAAVQQVDVYTQIDVIPPSCPKCGCTDREPYFAIKRLAISGVTPAGVPYTRITFRRTRCKGCGQSRIDRVFESPAEAAA